MGRQPAYPWKRFARQRLSRVTTPQAICCSKRLAARVSDGNKDDSRERAGGIACRRQDRPQRNGANNDSGIVQPPTGGPIFLAIYVAAPNASPEARDDVVAEAAKVPIAALTRPAGAPK